MTQAQTAAAAFARHGGRIDAAAAAFPGAPRPWIDLSTGISPVPWVPPAALAVDAAPLPAPSDLAALEAAAAGWFGAAPARVVAVPGSELALRLLPALGLPGPIVAARPSYGTHGDVADAGCDPSTLEAAPRSGTLLLANPNNPDGRLHAPAALHRLAADRAEAGGWLVVDEAFADTMPGASILPGLDPALPAIVLRSFGKFFGLAGVRLGFVVAPEPVAARLRRLLGDWPVSAYAIAWGRAAYADADWIAATRARIDATAVALDALLARHGFAAQGACPLFRLVADARAPGLFVRLAQAGILTRPFGDRPDWLRFGLPADAAAFERLDRALGRG